MSTNYLRRNSTRLPALPASIRFLVCRPMGGGAFGIVSQHRTESGAQRSLARQRAGAKKQGGYSQDYLAEIGD